MMARAEGVADYLAGSPRGELISVVFDQENGHMPVNRPLSMSCSEISNETLGLSSRSSLLGNSDRRIITKLLYSMKALPSKDSHPAFTHEDKPKDGCSRY